MACPERDGPDSAPFSQPHPRQEQALCCLSPFITKPSEILQIVSPVIVFNHSVLAGASSWNHKAATVRRGLLFCAQEGPPPFSSPLGSHTVSQTGLKLSMCSPGRSGIRSNSPVSVSWLLSLQADILMQDLPVTNQARLTGKQALWCLDYVPGL